VSAPSVDGFIEIDLAGGCVRVRGIVDAQMLREVLAADLPAFVGPNFP
jgi:hypothetical protein